MVDKVQVKIRQPLIGLPVMPVVMVTCVDKNKIPNIITVGWIGGVCSEPPQLGIAIRRKPKKRYSYDLIKESKEFVINIPNEDIVEIVDKCGLASGKHLDKFKEFGLTPLAASKVGAPLIKECPVNLECKLREHLVLGSHGFFIGEVVAVNVDEEIASPEGDPDFSKTYPYVLRHYDYCGLKNKRMGFYGYTQK